jgi:hypothetical protein
MRTKAQLWLLLMPLSFMLCSIAVLGKRASSPDDQNSALVLGEAGEQYYLSGTGGIKISGGHHGIWASNMKANSIAIDGSGIQAKNFTANDVNSDFNALVDCAYFVSSSCICTLPMANGWAGHEIVVGNRNKDATIKYQSFNGELLPGSEQIGQLVNSTQGKIDKFISDGKTWYRE